MHAAEILAGNIGVARLLGTAAIEHRIELREELRNRLVDTDIDARVERDALAFHLLGARVDIVFFHLEIGNAEAHQPADAALALEHLNRMAGAAKLLRGSHAGRTGTDDRDLLARLGHRPAAASRTRWHRPCRQSPAPPS
jgi:hypothetical protein